MPRTRNTGSGQANAPTPLQEITQFFCTASLSDARVAIEIAQTIVAARAAVPPLSSTQAPGPLDAAPAIAAAILDTPINADGRVRRGRGRPRTGLPAILAASVGLPAQVGELPEQITPEDE